MNDQAYELEVQRNAQSLNCQSLGYMGIGGLAPQSIGGCCGTPYWIQPAYPPSPADYEITIQQFGDGEPLLNYGPKLRLLIADPIKGIDLREALHKLKIALKQCRYEH